MYRTNFLKLIPAILLPVLIQQALTVLSSEKESMGLGRHTREYNVYDNGVAIEYVAGDIIYNERPLPEDSLKDIDRLTGIWTKPFPIRGSYVFKSDTMSRDGLKKTAERNAILQSLYRESEELRKIDDEETILSKVRVKKSYGKFPSPNSYDAYFEGEVTKADILSILLPQGQKVAVVRNVPVPEESRIRAEIAELIMSVDNLSKHEMLEYVNCFENTVDYYHNGEVTVDDLKTIRSSYFSGTVSKFYRPITEPVVGDLRDIGSIHAYYTAQLSYERDGSNEEVIVTRKYILRYTHEGPKISSVKEVAKVYYPERFRFSGEFNGWNLRQLPIPGAPATNTISGSSKIWEGKVWRSKGDNNWSSVNDWEFVLHGDDVGFVNYQRKKSERSRRGLFGRLLK
ncbi:MAG: hypothetical protein P1V20_22605 [Verrucomicrobiales bacterium]|nr:hypothetical protein [Verrucomicrobiales bacterium]